MSHSYYTSVALMQVPDEAQSILFLQTIDYRHRYRVRRLNVFILEMTIYGALDRHSDIYSKECGSRVDFPM